MLVISDSETLAAFVARHADAPYLLIDTEFLREQTYYPKLCLIQIAGPQEAVIVDALAEGLDLSHLEPLLADQGIIKVFHAGRQDLEIFHKLYGFVPTPLFDTQVAAMVCGFGEQVAFDTLVKRITGKSLDKVSRFTDWARRPLSSRQLDYALADVVHLRPVYLELAKSLAERKRAAWVEEEMGALAQPSLYVVDPQSAWERIKARSRDTRFLGRLQALAAWREREAQERDLPRQRLLRDEQLQEIAANNPGNAEKLAHARGFSRQAAEGKLGQRILAVLANAEPMSTEQLPRRQERPTVVNAGSRGDLLRVLLRLASEAHGVAPRLIANGNEIDRLAAGERDDLRVLSTWRAEVFGQDAIALLEGRLALACSADSVQILERDDQGAWAVRNAP
ncbi:MAG: ribonuclease D [Kiloniellales bacterium]